MECDISFFLLVSLEQDWHAYLILLLDTLNQPFTLYLHHFCAALIALNSTSFPLGPPGLPLIATLLFVSLFLDFSLRTGHGLLISFFPKPKCTELDGYSMYII
jgi:hypothetical protein